MNVHGDDLGLSMSFLECPRKGKHAHPYTVKIDKSGAFWKSTSYGVLKASSLEGVLLIRNVAVKKVSRQKLLGI